MLRYIETPARAARGGRSNGTLVLLHAFPLHAGMWEPQSTLADHGWRLVAPHMRGMNTAAEGGNSRWQRGDRGLSIDDYAGDVIDVLDALHIDEAVFAGLSLGGYVAFAVFRLAPRYVRGLILADTRAEADTPEGLEARRRMLALNREKGPSAIAAEMVPKLLGRTSQRERPDLVERVRRLVLDNPADAIDGAISALMSRPDSTGLLATIHCPTLILVGEEDTITPPSFSEQMQRAIAGSTCVTLPHAGHLSSLEQPELFNAEVARFLDHRV